MTPTITQIEKPQSAHPWYKAEVLGRFAVSPDRETAVKVLEWCFRTGLDREEAA